MTLPQVSDVSVVTSLILHQSINRMPAVPCVIRVTSLFDVCLMMVDVLLCINIIKKNNILQYKLLQKAIKCNVISLIKYMIGIHCGQSHYGICEIWS